MPPIKGAHADHDIDGKHWKEKYSKDKQMESEKTAFPCTNDLKIYSMIQKLQK